MVNTVCRSYRGHDASLPNTVNGSIRSMLSLTALQWHVPAGNTFTSQQMIQMLAHQFIGECFDRLKKEENVRLGLSDQLASEVVAAVEIARLTAELEK